MNNVKAAPRTHRAAERSGPLRPSALRCGVVGLVAMLALAACSSSQAKEATPTQLNQAGLVATTRGDDDAAVAAFRQVLAKDSGNVLAHYNLGVIYQKKGNASAAVTEYAAALMTNAHYVPALYNTATILAATNTQAAIMLYRQVIGLDPKHAASYLNLGLLELQVGQRAAAQKDVAAAVVLNADLLPRVPAELRPNTPQIINGTPVPAPSAS